MRRLPATKRLRSVLPGRRLSARRCFLVAVCAVAALAAPAAQAPTGSAAQQRREMGEALVHDHDDMVVGGQGAAEWLESKGPLKRLANGVARVEGFDGRGVPDRAVGVLVDVDRPAVPPDFEFDRSRHGAALPGRRCTGVRPRGHCNAPPRTNGRG